MTPASAHAEANRQVCVAALAVIVRADLMGREDAVDRLVRQRARKPLSPEAAKRYPAKYSVARELAVQIRLGDMAYGAAEITLAIAIDGGRFSDEFYQAQERAARMLDTACRRLDRLVATIAKELQDEIASDGCERQSTDAEAAYA